MLKQKPSQPWKAHAERGRWDNLRKQIDQMSEAVSLPGTWNQEDFRSFCLLLAEYEVREQESLLLYDPLPTAILFHRCMAHEIALSGSNRAGKTNASAAEVAYAATGTHPIEDKYPRTGLQIACIGNDEKHLSLMYEYLFEKAPFQVFQHPVTFEWTVVVESEHEQYRHLWKQADPLIPPRMVKQISWLKKKEKIARSVILTNGTRIRFYSGLVRKMPQGRKFNLCWLDEELEQAQGWVDEMRARIVDTNGRLFWSATPQNATEAFLDMQMLAKDPENETKPLEQQTAYFLMKQVDNKYLSAKGSAAFKAKMMDNDEQMLVRFEGQSARSFLTVYHEFERKLHVIPQIELRWEDTRYIVVDPGVDLAAVLFLVVPQTESDPEKLKEMSPVERAYRSREGCIVCYDEIYQRRTNAAEIAQLTKAKLDAHPQAYLQEMILDKVGGKSMIWKGMKEDENAAIIYLDHFTKCDINPVVPGWQAGASDIRMGINKTKDYLVGDKEGPYLFVTQNCKKLIWEFGAWKKTRNSKGQFIDYEKANNHLLDCVRYATTRGVTWVPPPSPVGPRPFGRKELGQMLRDLKSGKAFY